MAFTMQIQGFSTYWGGEIYHDAQKQIYRAFGNGHVRKRSYFRMLNPFSPVYARGKSAVKNVKNWGNLTGGGDGSIMGGCLLVRQGEGGIGYMHVEKSFGEYPEIAALVRECRAAVCQGGG
eukprot:jgi/Chrzof1/9380/Cz04g00200.t1